MTLSLTRGLLGRLSSASLLLGCVVAFGLVGCSDENNDTTTTPDMSTSTPDMPASTPDMDTTGDMPASTPDMDTTADMPSTTPDMETTPDMAMTCATENQCFSNEDCGETERCASISGEINGCCEVGARGTKAPGEMCTTANECDTGLCVDNTYCSKTCQSDSDCITDLPKCNAVYGLCIPSE